MSGIPIRRPYPVLSADDVGRIHSTAVAGLEAVGVKIGTDRGRKLLQKAGAEVDARTHIVRIPSSLVEEILKKRVPVTMYGRHPSQDAVLDFQHVHVCNDGCGVLAVDYETGERHESTSEDLARAARVGNAMDNLHVFWPTVTSMDVPDQIRTFVDAKISFTNTDKHILSATTITTAEAKGLVAMATAVAGGTEELRRKPILSSVETSIAPLQHEAGNIDAALIFGDAGVPVAIFTMPGPGTTGPVTLAGSIVVGAMEFLSGLVMCRLNNPKAPVIWGCGIAPLDMKTTTRAAGSPEHGLTGAAVTQVAHAYGVPSLCGGFDSTASAPGTQAAIEQLVSGFSLVLGGADLIVGVGQLEDARTLWLEELLIDDEMVNMIRRIADGIVVDDDSLALDVIKKVGVGGMFLGQRHTMEHLRTEHFIPKLVDRRSFDLWDANGRKSMEDRARARIEEILARPVPHPLSADVVKKLDRIIDGARVPVPAA